MRSSSHVTMLRVVLYLAQEYNTPKPPVSPPAQAQSSNVFSTLPGTGVFQALKQTISSYIPWPGGSQPAASLPSPPSPQKPAISAPENVVAAPIESKSLTHLPPLPPPEAAVSVPEKIVAAPMESKSVTPSDLPEQKVVGPQELHQPQLISLPVLNPHEYSKSKQNDFELRFEDEDAIKRATDAARHFIWSGSSLYVCNPQMNMEHEMIWLAIILRALKQIPQIYIYPQWKPNTETMNLFVLKFAYQKTYKLDQSFWAALRGMMSGSQKYLLIPWIPPSSLYLEIIEPWIAKGYRVVLGANDFSLFRGDVRNKSMGILSPWRFTRDKFKAFQKTWFVAHDSSVISPFQKLTNISDLRNPEIVTPGPHWFIYDKTHTSEKKWKETVSEMAIHHIHWRVITFQNDEEKKWGNIIGDREISEEEFRATPLTFSLRSFKGKPWFLIIDFGPRAELLVEVLYWLYGRVVVICCRTANESAVCEELQKSFKDFTNYLKPSSVSGSSVPQAPSKPLVDIISPTEQKKQNLITEPSLEVTPSVSVPQSMPMQSVDIPVAPDLAEPQPIPAAPPVETEIKSIANPKEEQLTTSQKARPKPKEEQLITSQKAIQSASNQSKTTASKPLSIMEEMQQRLAARRAAMQPVDPDPFD